MLLIENFLIFSSFEFQEKSIWGSSKSKSGLSSLKLDGWSPKLNLLKINFKVQTFHRIPHRERPHWLTFINNICLWYHCFVKDMEIWQNGAHFSYWGVFFKMMRNSTLVIDRISSVTLLSIVSIWECLIGSRSVSLRCET